MAVVHAESYLIEVSIAVVLRYRAPCVAERIDAVVIFFRHSHILADFLDTAVYVCAEAVRVAVALMEVKQVFILRLGQILVKYRLYERLNSHFHICVVRAAVACLGAIVAYLAASIV